MTFQTFTGRDYLKIDIANNFGLDKLTWQDRLDWFHQNQGNLHQLLDQAAEPALFYSAIRAYEDVQKGKPIGYTISLDATSSGLQILAALTGDRLAAELCNVVDTGQRQDAYTAIYNRMLGHLGQNAKIKRDDVKQAIMTSLYSSKAVPKQVFGEGKLLDLFYQTMQAAAPGAWELNETMLQLWDPAKHSNDWIMPDNFHVHIPVMDTVNEKVHFDNKPYDISYKVNQPIAEGRSLGANMVHAIDGMLVREMVARCDYDRVQVDRIADLLQGGQLLSRNSRTKEDKLVIALWDHYQQSGFLSARILTYLNADNIRNTDFAVIRGLLKQLPAMPFKVIPIHDCFRCLPQYGNDLRWQYNILLAMIAESELLSYLIGQLVGEPVQIGKLDPTLYLDILETNYALS